MLNITELERKHKKYKLKSNIPYFIIVTLLIIITVLIYIILNSQNKISNPIKTETIKQTPTIEPKTKKQIQKVLLYPSFEFLKHIEQTYTKTNLQPKTKPAPKQAEKKIEKINNKETTHIDNIQKPVNTKKDIEIKRQNTKEDIQHVLNRFEKNNNPALSLFVAKKYYELGNYQKASKYALITNEINNKIDDSWIVFAKSLFKMGKKDKAINVLKSYINHSNSAQAKVLLDDILKGKFYE